MKRTSLLAALVVTFAATPAFAQGAQASNPNDGVTWYLVSYAKFKPGMADEARKIIYEHFWPIDKEIGREVIPFDHVTGEWDHVVYFPMAGGPGDLAIRETPLGKRWDEALVRREGGREKADALQKRFDDMVLAEKTDIVRRRTR